MVRGERQLTTILSLNIGNKYGMESHLGRKTLKFTNERICRMCGYAYEIKNSRQKYCGSWKKGIGCSLIIHKEQSLIQAKKWYYKVRDTKEYREKERIKRLKKYKRSIAFNHCRCHLCPIHFIAK